MKKMRLLWLALIGCTQLFAATPSPIGYWKTIDDVSGKPKAILQISMDANNTLSGHIVKTFATPGERKLIFCTACKDERHNQPILGLVILEQLKHSETDPLAWENGQILDPKNGNFYHCNLRVADNGQQLRVRGYIGLPMFGRSQTWVKINGPATDKPLP